MSETQPTRETEDRIAHLRLTAESERLVLIVDRSAEAGEVPDAAARLLAALGEGRCAAVHDLGGQEGLSAVQWLRSPSRSAPALRVLAPTLAAIDRDGHRDCPRLVLAGGPIWDLAEFSGDRDRLRIAAPPDTVALPPQCPDVFSVEDLDDADRLSASLFPRLAEVAIHQPGFMPYAWDNPGYRLTMETGEVALAWRGDGPVADVSLRYISSQPQAPLSAHVTQSDGSTSTLEIASEPAPEYRLTDRLRRLGELSDAEARALKQSAAGHPFTCPRCGHAHPAGTLRCPRDTRIGTGRSSAVYECTEHALGLILFIEQSYQVLVYEAQDPVTRVERRCVVDAGPPAVCYQYDESAGRWTAHVIAGYHHVEPVTFLFLGEGEPDYA